MKTYAALAAKLVCGGFALGFIASAQVVMGGWFGGAGLFADVFSLLAAHKKIAAERAGRQS